MTFALLLCSAVALVLVAVAGAVVIGATVARSRQVAADRDAQEVALPDLGLVRLTGSPWHEGSIGGRRIAVKASRTASIGALGTSMDGRTQEVLLVALVELPLSPVGGAISEAARHRADTSFDTAFFAEGGARLDAVPPAAQAVLLRWLHETGDHLAVIDRDHRLAYAGAALRGAGVIARVGRTGTADADALRAWIDDLVARADALA